MTLQDEVSAFRATVGSIEDREPIRECLTRHRGWPGRGDCRSPRSACHGDVLDRLCRFLAYPAQSADRAFARYEYFGLATHHCSCVHRRNDDGDVAHAETYFRFGTLGREGASGALGGGRYIDLQARPDGMSDRMFVDDRLTTDDRSSVTSTRSPSPQRLGSFLKAALGLFRNCTAPPLRRPRMIAPKQADAYRRMIGGP